MKRTKVDLARSDRELEEAVENIPLQWHSSELCISDPSPRSSASVVEENCNPNTPYI